uniref:Ribosomal protein L16 n=1 Tax=Trachydiscus minutus TaxID=1032745 RepID=A0A140F2R0_9STRA|nr:ribosomal protein L16 [Trachydiscus minutus]AML60694.1 ribosomal protein L16 [Trachydiscus minutus]
MLLRPQKTKFNKFRRSRLTRIESSFKPLKFGRFGLVAQECGLISARQIESTRQVINRYLKRKGKIWIRIFPDFPMTSKPTEVRMGKGKGAVKLWLCRVKKGKILFEVDGASDYIIEEAFSAAKKKLSLKSFILKASWRLNKKV